MNQQSKIPGKTSLELEIDSIREHLGIHLPNEAIFSEINKTLKVAPKNAARKSESICSEYPLRALPDKYFMAQEFAENNNDLRVSIEDALKQLGKSSIRTDSMYLSWPILCKICALIQGTPFGVYQLSTSQNRNVHLELGIAMGLGKPFVLVKDKDAKVTDLVRDLEYYKINSYLETKYELGNLLQRYIASIEVYRPKRLSTPGSLNTVIIAHGQQDVIDSSVTIARQITKYGYTPIILSQIDTRLSNILKREGIKCQFCKTRNEVVESIQEAQFGVYRVDKSSNADVFVALGISIGLNRPFVLINSSREGIPSDLAGLGNLEFNGFIELESKFKIYLENWNRSTQKL